MSIFINDNGSLVRQDAAAIAQLAATDTENILGGGAGATTDGQTLVDQLAADDVQAQTDIGQIRTDLSDYHVVPSKNKAVHNGYGHTLASMTFTEDADGAIDVNGTVTGSNAFYYVSVGLEWSNEQMVISGCPAGGSSSGYMLICASSDGGSTVYAADTGSGAVVPANTGGSNLTLNIYIRVQNGASVSHKKFYPMLCSKAAYDADPTYEPYFLPMRDGKLDIADEQILGAWNLAKITAVTQTAGGTMTVTVNSDKSIKLNTSGATTSSVGIILGEFELPAGTFYFTGGLCESSDANTNRLALTDENGGYTELARDLSGYNRFTLSEPKTVRIRLYVLTGSTFSNKMIYPMVATKDNSQYVAPTMTNRELTELKESSLTTTYTVSTGQGGNHLFKKGGVVQMILALEGVTAAAWTTLATVPQGYRPVATKGGYTTRGGTYPFFVTTGGALQCGTALTSANVNFYMTWLTNE